MVTEVTKLEARAVGLPLPCRLCSLCRETAANQAQLDKLADSVRATGGEACAFDVARQERDMVELFADIERALGPLEVVSTLAQTSATRSARPARVFTKVWEMACFAAFITGREAAKVIVPRGRGSILFTGATASLRGGAGFAAFAAPKSGLRALAQGRARELGPQIIHVAHVVVGGAIDGTFILHGCRRRRAARARRDPQAGRDRQELCVANRTAQRGRTSWI